MNALAILAMIAKYGPTVVSVVETYGPVVWSVGSKAVELIEASAAKGTLEQDLGAAVEGGKALLGAIGPLTSLKDLGDVLSSVNTVDQGNPQPGDHSPTGTHR